METNQKIETRIQLAEERFITPLLYPESRPFDVALWEAPGEPVSYQEASEQTYTSVEEGARWGREWGTAWFHFRATVPQEWKGKAVVGLIDLSFEDEEGFGREGQVWVGGVPTIAVSRYRKAVPCFSVAKGEESIDFLVEASANPKPEWHWNANERKEMEKPLFRLRQAQLATYDKEVFSFLMDFQVCREAMFALDESKTRRARLRRGLDQVCRLMERGQSSWIGEARGILAPLLAARNGDTRHTITATGHAHIDTAWCWPLRETIRKCARTFSTALAYMKEHPDYRFSCSQPVQYLWMKKHYPSIYEGIRKAVAEGRWEPMGSMWVEPDCNVPSGESFVRQLVHGKAFFRREFGVENRELWLPDVFGYSAALPQILAKAGVDRFLTQKISWNDTNRFPHHTFWWEGIDGTRVFSHFPPVDTYNARVEARELEWAERNFAQKDRASRSLMPYGYGDGGGGPTVEMIERIRRLQDFEGLPAVDFGTVDEFFTAAENDIEEPPVWRGELYLELHRGTYTSQAHNKLMNRRCELLLREAEFMDVIASQISSEDLLKEDPWPDRTPWDVDDCGPEKKGSMTAKALDRAWKLLLLNQFHDILPGSSIQRVYEESRRDYEVIEAIAVAVRESGIERLMEKEETRDDFTVINTLAQQRGEVIVHGGRAKWVDVPSCGYRTYEMNPDSKLPEGVAATEIRETNKGWELSNGLLALCVDGKGVVQSCFDQIRERETLSGPANEFHLLRDYPNRWSAWDIEASAMEDFEVLDGEASARIAESGPLRVVLEGERSFGNSVIRQRIVLRAGSARVDFETEIDWRERDKALKVAFPLAVRSEYVQCEIQSGQVQRSVHRNTSWDAARFEQPIQQWIDMAEADYGVAILNNGIFGCDVLGERVRLTLLKSASAPDPEADVGTHRRIFSLFPHAGATYDGGVIEEALALNNPLIVRNGIVPDAPEKSWLGTDCSGLRLDALKRAEDGEGIVMRWVEASGRSVQACIRCDLKGVKFSEADLLERSDKVPVDLQKLEMRAFDIRTFRSVRSWALRR
jgi:alpha-mannosidase